MIKKMLIAILLIFANTTFAQKADDIIGKYHLPNDLDIEIFKVGNEYQGKIIALNSYEDGQTTDIKNPDETKHDTPLLGMVIIKGLVFDEDDKEWIDGEMYGPEKGMVFNLKITEIREKEIEVVGSKYLFWHTLKWLRI
jgi:uncharacterized protein (DUF2147 family)